DFPAPLTASPPFPDSTALLAAVVFANHGSTVRRFLAFQRREVHTIALRAPPRNPSSSTGSACGYVLIAQRGRRSLVLGDLIKQRLCLASERKGRIGDKGDQHRDRFLFAGAHEGGGRLIADARISIRQQRGQATTQIGRGHSPQNVSGGDTTDGPFVGQRGQQIRVGPILARAYREESVEPYLFKRVVERGERRQQAGGGTGRMAILHDFRPVPPPA